MKKRILQFIIYTALIGWIIYQFGVPKIITKNAYEDSIKLYNSINTDSLNWETIGYSTRGENIYFTELGDSQEITLIVGNIHGAEFGGFNLALRLARYIKAHPHLITKKVIIIPTINPDGMFDSTRKNSNEIDLNRNFPSKDWSPVYSSKKYYPGTKPASEVETKLIIKVIDKYKPKKIIDIHSGMYLVDYDGPAKSLAYKMASLNGYEIIQDVGYETPGSLASYTGVDLGIATIILELPTYSPDQSWEDNKDALIAAINF